MTEMTNYYNGIADGYDSLHKEEQIRKLEVIRDLDLINKEDKLLDVGCGTAFSLDYFDAKGVTGIDPSEKLIEKYTGEHKVLVGPAEKLPFENNSFDVVISITAIQNFEDIKLGLEEIKRVGNDRFALTYLKRSPKADFIEECFKEVFEGFEILRYEEERDIIFVITHV